MDQIHYTVDGEPQETDQPVLTPIRILKDAGVDPVTNYLVQIQGDHRISYQDKPNEEIHMRDHMKFISISIAPTPVS